MKNNYLLIGLLFISHLNAKKAPSPTAQKPQEKKSALDTQTYKKLQSANNAAQGNVQTAEAEWYNRCIKVNNSKKSLYNSNPNLHYANDSSCKKLKARYKKALRKATATSLAIINFEKDNNLPNTQLIVAMPGGSISNEEFSSQQASQK